VTKQSLGLVSLRIIAALLFVGAGVAAIARTWVAFLDLADPPTRILGLSVILTLLYLSVVLWLLQSFCLPPYADRWRALTMLGAPSPTRLTLVGIGLIVLSLIGPMIQLHLPVSLFMAGWGVTHVQAAAILKRHPNQT